MWLTNKRNFSFQNVPHGILQLHQATRYATANAPATPASLPRKSRSVSWSLCLLFSSSRPLPPAIPTPFNVRVFQPVSQPRVVPGQKQLEFPLRQLLIQSILPEQWRPQCGSQCSQFWPEQGYAGKQLDLCYRWPVSASVGGQLRVLIGRGSQRTG